MMKAAIFNNDVPWVKGGCMFDIVFAQGRRQELAELAELYPVQINDDNFEEHVGNLRDLEVIFSTWDMPKLTDEQVKKMPNLKVLFYAAGATNMFREPFEKNGVAVCSATAANGIPVAEFTLAQILLAGAGYWRNSRECVDSHSTYTLNNHRGHGNYGARVSILGNGTISTLLQEFLKPHDLDIIVVPSLADNMTHLLEEAFENSIAIVNLFPGCDELSGVLNRSSFERMIDSAVFINVGRGLQINEPDLIAVMKERPDLTALLDVQWPEPPEDGSELYTLPNIRLSGHHAGAKGRELVRMADYMIEDFLRLQKGEPLVHQVHPDQL